MKNRKDKIALGGGCHWCTEAVFLSLKGVEKVEQGFVASEGKNSTFSEAVIIHFNKDLIRLYDLIEIHLHTHKSTSNHSMRSKYRSAIYTYSEGQAFESKQIIAKLQSNFEKQLITKIYSFKRFEPSENRHKNYYFRNPKKPFCETFINPKLKLLLQKFSDKINHDKIAERQINF